MKTAIVFAENTIHAGKIAPADTPKGDVIEISLETAEIWAKKDPSAGPHEAFLNRAGNSALEVLKD